MGRKPNTIVSEFFHRGNKLPDSSNRYEHTCKLCGENFPKGRPDSLLGHLTKGCQAISLTDKQRVIHLLRGLSSSGPVSKRSLGNGRSDRARGNNLSYAARATFNSTGGHNALNVLAEASRRVGATDNTGQAKAAQGQKTIVVDPALESSSSAVIGFNKDFTAWSTQPSQLLMSEEESCSSAHVSASSLPDSPSEIRHSSQLSLIAASANEMVSEDPVAHLNSDVSFRKRKFHAQSPDNMQSPAIYSRPIADTNLRNDVLPSVSTELHRVTVTKHRYRSAFSEERRKEVQLVRKMGACLRCRMLKKTVRIE
ncbi:hypothetical protein PRK78_007117 [Emydomyces testavorans]|uniref:Uncharacterized protein n=1 Tax=Emydomyces testavorans TaxID=2070801 RepID=A0AAF0DQT8_9EURO|nr:hypothetical protein PRK78_007117 [Emydomyces testavorans]